MSERAWLEAADRPPAWTTRRGKVTREDLFNEIDILRSRVAQKDGMMDPAIRASLTRVRSLAATLVPAPPRFVCGFDYGNGVTCGVEFASIWARAAHRELVHEVPSDLPANVHDAERVGLATRRRVVVNQGKCPCGDANCSSYRRQRFHDARAKQLEIELDAAYAERRKARAEWVEHLDAFKAAA